MDKEVERFFKKVKKIVDPEIKKVLDLDVSKKFHNLLNYQIDVGGKRLRPALAMLSCLACGGKIKDVLYPAVGLEILHNYTLIIDDIIDESEFRREKFTTWRKFGSSVAQCVGVFYAAGVFQAANLSKKPIEVSRIFGFCLKKIFEGEILDILFERGGRENEPFIRKNRFKKVALKDYIEMVNKKTAILLQSSCEIGAMMANASKSQIEALKDYGYNLGIAFQITDDILDIYGKKREFGKKIGGDIQERKLGNILVLFALKDLPKSKKREFLDILKKREIKKEDIKRGIKLIKETKAKERATIIGEKYIKKSKESLKVLKESKWRRILEKIADLIIVREK